MARWTQMDVSSATTGGQGLQGAFDLTDGVGHYQQDLTAFLKNAERDRAQEAHSGRVAGTPRKFATIPDAVALKILEDHHLDLHAQEFMDDPNNMRKFKQVILSEYPYLVVNK